VYRLRGREAEDFQAWLSRSWLTAAHVHLRDRPGFAVWLWWQALRVHPPHALHPASCRLLGKAAGYPLYRAWVRKQSRAAVAGRPAH
jgi:hypothetical protein